MDKTNQLIVKGLFIIAYTIWLLTSLHYVPMLHFFILQNAHGRGGRGWKLPSDAAPRARVGNGRSRWSISSCKVLSSAGEVSLRWPLLLARTSQRTPGFCSRRFKRSCCWCNSGIFWFKGRKWFGIFWYIQYDQLKRKRERHIMNWTLHALFRFRRQKPSLLGQPILMTYPCFEPRGYIPSFPELSWPLCSHDLGAAQVSCPGDALKKNKPIF